MTRRPSRQRSGLRLCKVRDRTVRQVDLDLIETALREWVKRAAEEGETTSAEALSTSERDELMDAVRAAVPALDYPAWRDVDAALDGWPAWAA